MPTPKIKVYDMAQGSPEWHTIRLGRMTASEAQCVATSGKGLDTYAMELAAERLTGLSADSWQGNADTERGKELEDDARTLYEWRGNKVKQVGFIAYGGGAGCSPDGLVGNDGGVEIKCPNDVKFMAVVLDGFIDSKYQWQMQMNMLITGRAWWDYVVYNPHFKEPLSVIRVVADKEKQYRILAGLKLGEKKITEIIKKMGEKK